MRPCCRAPLSFPPHFILDISGKYANIDNYLFPRLLQLRRRLTRIFAVPFQEKPMGITVDFSKSSAYKERFPDVPFGLTLITGCTNHQNPPGFDQYKRKLLRKMRKRETLSGIRERIESYDRFFASFGQECPLPKHLERTINSGFPRYDLIVDAHFMAEMCAGILVAATDYRRFDGSLTLDLAEEGELCRGMGDREFRTREGEIVFRDEKEIVCVLCQGADEKTRVRESTEDAFFYAYGIPGIDGGFLEQGLTIAADTMIQFGGGILQAMEVY
jgi:DNA/RNA-binding domain of Phe-tRNA-synthetase-like protein